jgi:hypothetical protein
MGEKENGRKGEWEKRRMGEKENGRRGEWEIKKNQITPCNSVNTQCNSVFKR